MIPAAETEKMRHIGAERFGRQRRAETGIERRRQDKMSASE